MVEGSCRSVSISLASLRPPEIQLRHLSEKTMNEKFVRGIEEIDTANTLHGV